MMEVTILGLLIPLLMLIFSLLLFYWVVRKGVAAGIKDYMHKHGDRVGNLRP